MKAAVDHSQTAARHQPVAAHDGQEGVATGAWVDGGAASACGLISQMARLESLYQSPRVVAQRQQMRGLMPSPNRTGMPDGLKTGIESLSGLSLDHVKVHYNSSQPAQLNALAHAQGSDIHLAPGQEQHLPHEAWHVVQQAQGRVRPTMQTKAGTAINDDVGLEREADVMGAKALQTKALQPVRSRVSPPPAIQARSTATVQRVGEDWIATISQSLGIGVTAAARFVQYLLEHYPTAFIVGSILFTALLTLVYGRFASLNQGPGQEDGTGGRRRRNKRKGKKRRALKEREEQEEPEEQAGSGSEAEEESETENEVVDVADEASSSGSSVEVEEDVSDFKWVSKKGKRTPTRDKSIPLTPYRNRAWQEFVSSQPTPRKRKSKPKVDPGRAVFESRQRERAAAAAAVPDEPAFSPYVQVNLPNGRPFFVDITTPAEGSKSSSQAGNAGTKPLAVVYGRFGGATAGESEGAQVHVHFDDDNPINSHTGAHVKIGDDYEFSWGRGEASAQASLSSILTQGFHGDGWKSPGTYRRI